jgi:Tol biopolymer transport system component
MYRITLILTMAVAAACSPADAGARQAPDAELRAHADRQPTPRRVWAHARDYATPSPDGRLIAFVDWSTGDVAVHDLATGEDRRITDKGTWEQNGSWAEVPKFSADGRRVVYAFGNVEAGAPFVYEVRYVELGDTTQHLLFRNDPDDDWIAPLQWHATAGVLAIRHRADGSIRLGTIDGSGRFNTIRAFQRGDGHPRTAAISPDGSVLAVGVGDGIRLLRADGSGERRLDVAPARFLGWSPDGGAVLVHAERRGERGIWSVPVAGVRQAGEPGLVRGGIPALIPGGVAGDRLFYRVPVEGRRVYTAAVDVDAGRVLVRPSAVTTPGEGSASDPVWSPDGHSFAYVLRPPNDDIRIMVRSATGEHARVVATTRFSVAAALSWSRDGRFLYLLSEGLHGPALHRVGIDDGQFVKVADPVSRNIAILPDESGAVFSGDGVRHVDFATGTTRQVADRPANGDIALSPDGRTVVYAVRGRLGSHINAVSLEGGEPRELIRLDDGEHIELGGQSLGYTPDGRFLLAVVGTEEQHHRLVAYPVDGGPRRTLLDLGVRLEGPEAAHVRFHPDGRRVVYAHGQERVEMWVLEGLTPAGS